MSFDAALSLGSEFRTTAKRSNFVGNYSIGRTVGEGSYGKVKLATHVLSGEQVAIKILEKDRLASPKEYQHVYREIDILKSIRHPNVVRLLEVVDTADYLYVVMEYCGGGELFDYIVAQGKVGEAQARKFFRQTISALQHLHKLSIIHRDMKPENLLLDSEQNIKIVDFGFANITKPGELLSTFCGSPAYAAPEMVAGRQYTGPEADIWSAGVILYALICGFLPFDDPNQAVVYDLICSGAFEFPPDMPSGPQEIIRKMLVIEPTKRATLSQISRTPWMNIGYSSPCIDRSSGVQPPQILDDPSLRMELEELGFKPSAVQEALDSGEPNQITSTYYLLQKRLLKAEECESASPSPSIPRRGAPLSKTTSDPLVLWSQTEPSKVTTLPTMNEDELSLSTTPTLPPVLRPNSPSATPPLPSISQRRGSNSRVPRIGETTSPNSSSGSLVSEPRRSSFCVSDFSQSLPAKTNLNLSQGKVGSSLGVQPKERRRRASVAVPIANSSDSRPNEKGLRVVKGAFNIETASRKSGPEIKIELIRALGACKIHFTETEWRFQCDASAQVTARVAGQGLAKPGPVSFEMEVVRIQTLHMNGVRLRRVSGDPWHYKRLMHHVVAQLSL